MAIGGVTHRRKQLYRGDVNLDGKVNSKDHAVAAKTAAAARALPGSGAENAAQSGAAALVTPKNKRQAGRYLMYHADVNLDGKITKADARRSDLAKSLLAFANQPQGRSKLMDQKVTMAELRAYADRFDGKDHKLSEHEVDRMFRALRTERPGTEESEIDDNVDSGTGLDDPGYSDDGPWIDSTRPPAPEEVPIEDEGPSEDEELGGG